MHGIFIKEIRYCSFLDPSLTSMLYNEHILSFSPGVPKKSTIHHIPNTVFSSFPHWAEHKFYPGRSSFKVDIKKLRTHINYTSVSLLASRLEINIMQKYFNVEYFERLGIIVCTEPRKQLLQKGSKWDCTYKNSQHKMVT